MHAFARKLRWWHAGLVAGVVAAVVTFAFVYEPHDDTGITWEFELRGSTAPDGLDRAKHLLAARLAGTTATVSVAGDRVVVTLPHDDDHHALLADSGFIESQLRLPRAEIELRFFNDGSLVMENLVDLVRRDKTATDLGIVATTERRQLGKREQVDHYLQAADKGRYVNLAWAKRMGCADDAEAARRRIEGLGVYCTVSGADLIRAYLEGDDDLGVPALAGFALPPSHALLFAANGKDGWRTHLVESTLMLDPTNVVDVREGVDHLIVRLKTSAADHIAARVPKHRIATFPDGVHAVIADFTQQGLQAELSIPIQRGEADDLVFAFDVAALGQLVLLPPSAPR